MKSTHFYQAGLFTLILIALLLTGCRTGEKEMSVLLMPERQITFSAKTHSLDNNDNFSPDGKYLCYDTRGTVFDENLANSKSIEMVNIDSGVETVLWNPPSVTGLQAAPGVAAVSWHPSESKVVFIHGPFLDEVAERGYYDKPNRTGMEVTTDGSQKMIRVDMRDVATGRPTTPGAHRGGTHRHEYSRDGQRIGFTYDDFLLRDYDRTIGYLQLHPQAPEGYTHYFAILVKPVPKGQSKAGEIEKAAGDSWVDSSGSQRAFIARIRAANGIDYTDDLCVVDIPDTVNIQTADAGSSDRYPQPPKGIRVRRLTHNGRVSGIVRGAPDGQRIAFLRTDKNNVPQVTLIPANGSDRDGNMSAHPVTVSSFDSAAQDIRWHPGGDWLLCISDGNIAAIYVGEGERFGKSIWLSRDQTERSELVVSPDGRQLAYVCRPELKDAEGNDLKDVSGQYFRQIYIMALDMERIYQSL